MTERRDPEPVEDARRRIHVALSVKVDSSHLEVTTTLVNSTQQTVYVFNVLWDFSPAGPIVGPDSPAYACIQECELRLARRALPYPAGKKMLVAIDPYLSPVEPGATLNEHMVFPAPVHEYSCYFRRSLDSPVETLQASSARFEYGVVVGAVEGAFGPAPVAGARRLINPTKVNGIIGVKSAPVACEVTVLRRMDEFQRF